VAGVAVADPTSVRADTPVDFCGRQVTFFFTMILGRLTKIYKKSIK
jgi:hypothetical protein